jgi:hypothetical protein
MEPQLIEDIGIYIILIVMLINTFFMLKWMHKQSEKTSEIYSFIKELTEQSKNKE